MIAIFQAAAVVTLSTIVFGVGVSPRLVEAASHVENATSIPVHRISEKGVQEHTGEIHLRQTDTALEVIVEFASFPPGWHAMHIHENPSCGPALEDGVMVAGAAAGMHYDPTGVLNMGMDNAELAMPRDGKAMALARAQAAETMPTASKESAVLSAPRGRPRGDLPSVYVEEDGTTQYRILTYRLQLNELRGRSIMLHEYGEVPTDPTLPFGGGKRIACGVIS